VGVLEIGALIAATLISGALTQVVRRRALASGMLDVPNSRSSHVHPTPRGGGVAIVTSALAGVALLWRLDVLGLHVAAVLAVGGALIAAIGFIDDRFSLPALPRFAVHLLASLLLAMLLYLDGPTTSAALLWSSAALAATVVATAWSINLFNFMDGIDGLAASQAVFVSSASAVLCLFLVGSNSVPLLFITAGACLGFLALNWPPAKIFMGDVGSGFLGFWLAALAIVLYTNDSLGLPTSIVLNSVFIADATATLLKRMLSGKKWYEAHRSHAYQHLARRWSSHARVTLLLWLVNIFVVLPLALASALMPEYAVGIAVACLLALGCAALAAGAGRE
jgi:Fuc2NAc and GlcNAc transferase